MTESSQKRPSESLQLEPAVSPLTTEEYSGLTKNVNEKPRDSLLLYISAFAATLILFGGGTSMVWTSPVIGRLKSNNTEVNPLGKPATTLQISQIAGLLLLGALVGPLVFSKLCDHVGRRRTLMILSLIMLIANVALAFARYLYLYYICRFVLGMSLGAAISILSIFLSEISEDHNRGKIGCLMGLLLPMGNLYVYIIGPFLSIKIFTLACGLPFVVNLLGFLIFIPESPIWLAAKGRHTEAIQALEKLRNKKPADIEKEYEQITNTLLESSKLEKSSLKTIFTQKTYQNGLLIACGCNMIQQFSGVSAILAFAAPLFDEAQCGISGNMTGILIGSIKSCSLLITTSIVERVGRRPLLLVSSCGAGVSLFSLGLFFYLQSINSPWVSSIIWMPVISVLTYFISYSAGIGCIPMAMMGELFPNNVKATAVSLVTFVGMSSAFTVTTSFPLVQDLLGPTWCIWCFSFSCFAGFIFVFSYVPEIKGKSFLEVQEILGR